MGEVRKVRKIRKVEKIAQVGQVGKIGKIGKAVRKKLYIFFPKTILSVKPAFSTKKNIFLPKTMCLPKIMFLQKPWFHQKPSFHQKPWFYQKTMFSQKKTVFTKKSWFHKKNMFHQNPCFDQKPWIHQELCWTRFFLIAKNQGFPKKHVLQKTMFSPKKQYFPQNQKLIDLMGWPGSCIFICLLWSILRWVILTLLAFVLCYEVCHYFDPIPEPNEGAAQEQPQSSPKLCHLWMQGWHQESHQVKKATRDSAG